MLYAEPKTRACRILLATLAMLLYAMACLPSITHAVSRKHLLILNSYTPGYKWTADVIRGISDAVRRADKNVSIQNEFMDTKRASDDEYFRLLYEMYRYKFRNSQFDAVITTDNDAFNFLLKHRDQLFPATPVVFCGVNYFEPSQLAGAQLFTGVNETVDFKATLDLALKLHPNTRQIVVINDTTTTGRAMHDRIMALTPAYRGRVNFQFLEEVEMPEILARVRKLQADSLVFYTFFVRDKAGRIFDSDEAMSLIAQSSPVPIYGAWDFNLGHGIVGGMLTCGYSHGKTAGTMASRILQGERVENIPVVMESTNRYMFDYRQLRRFRIARSALPDGSTVINRPLGLYTVHRTTIWLIAVAVAGLMLIIVLLLRNMSIKKRAQAQLRQFAEHLEKRVKQRTEELEKSQRVLEEQNRILQETYHGLQEETANRIRVMEELRQRDHLLIHQSRMAAMGEMLGNVAHQWRQPLNVLGLKVQEIGLSYKFGQFSKELLDANIAKAMEILRHMSATIDDFRSFSTPDRQKVPFKVNEVIERTISLVGDNLRDQGIALETSSADDPKIDGYPNEYAQVLVNILMNSRDAFQQRQISEPRITLRCWTENGRAEVAISDNAGGIDESIIDKVFDAYFTTKELGKGTGIGLFMSKKIIETNMGGRLTVRNTGNGVEFRITV